MCAAMCATIYKTPLTHATTHQGADDPPAALLPPALPPPPQGSRVGVRTFLGWRKVSAQESPSAASARAARAATTTVSHIQAG